MCDDNTLSLMIRINHAFKVDRLTCEIWVSGGFPSCTVYDNRIDGSTDRNNALNHRCTNAPAKFRTVGQAETLPRTQSRPTRGLFASDRA